MLKHTQGPWMVNPATHDGWEIHGPRGVIGSFTKKPDAVLGAAAPDHALLLAAIIAGVARWERFSGDDNSGEVCVGGLRYAAVLDSFGCPEVTDARREVLRKAMLAAGRLP